MREARPDHLMIKQQAYVRIVMKRNQNYYSLTQLPHPARSRRRHPAPRRQRLASDATRPAAAARIDGRGPPRVMTTK